jgi:hypothetical protein
MGAINAYPLIAMSFLHTIKLGSDRALLKLGDGIGTISG